MSRIDTGHCSAWACGASLAPPRPLRLQTVLGDAELSASLTLWGLSVLEELLFPRVTVWLCFVLFQDGFSD